jgi:DNA-binding MarR family transcriptional regulator
MLSLTTFIVKCPVLNKGGQNLERPMAPREKPKKVAKNHSFELRATKRGRRGGLDFDVLNEHLGYFLRRLQVEVFKDFIRTLSVLDVRPAQYTVLVLIASNPGRSQAEIGEALNIERAGLAKMLNELETRGWILRLAAANDRRSHSLFLTPKGKKSLNRIKTIASDHETHVARLIGSKRRQQLMKLLKKFG